MLATSSNRTILSYIPLLQLTLSEIIECTKDKTFLSVEVIVIFSKISPERLDNFDNVRAECLQQNWSIDKSEDLPLGSITPDCTLQPTVLNQNMDHITLRDDLRIGVSNSRDGKHRRQVLKNHISYDSIKGYPLYSRLEFIIMNVCRSHQTARIVNTLIPLISPYSKDPLVAINLLEDLRAIILSRRVNEKKAMRKRLNHAGIAIVCDSPERFETFSITKTFHDMTSFQENVSQNNRICLQLDQAIFCPICPEQSGEDQSHVIDGFNIDLSPVE